MKAKILLKLSRPRTWFFIILAFLIGASLANTEFTWKAYLGLGIYVAWAAVTNIFNCYTDKHEDEMNLPDRTWAVRKVGDFGLLAVCIAIYSVTILLSTLINFTFFAIYLIAVFDSIAYSAKPVRAKSRPVLDLIFFSGAVFFPMVGGWTMEQPIMKIPFIIPFLTFWFAVYSTFKNIPDYHGDRKAGIRNSVTFFEDRDTAVKASFMMVLSPLILLGPLVTTGLIPDIMLLNMVWLPMLAVIHFGHSEKDSFRSLEKCHTLGFYYAMGFLAATLVLLNSGVWWSLLLTAGIFVMILVIHNRKIDSRPGHLVDDKTKNTPTTV